LYLSDPSLYSWFCLPRILHLSLPDALPIFYIYGIGRIIDYQHCLSSCWRGEGNQHKFSSANYSIYHNPGLPCCICTVCQRHNTRSEEHTSELQSRENLVCRLLLEKKKLHNC